MKNFIKSKPMQSIYWRTAMMIVAVLISQGLEVLPLLEPYISATSITFMGLVLGEISKIVNKRVQGVE